MPDNALARRLVTVTTVVALFIVVSAIVPLLVGVAASVDATRKIRARRPAIALRSLAFIWVYLLGELWALVALAATAPLPSKIKIAATYRLQDRWAGWNLTAVRRLFSVEFRVDGQDCLLPGPIVVLSRHASLVDTLLPARFVARPAGLRLRYVLKRELLGDPALDVAGNRLPNAFIDRASPEASERAAIESLTVDLGPRDGILIYPEGTRFSEEKLHRLKRRPSGGDRVAATTAGLRHVLPPKPGGTLAILDNTHADVVVLAHQGLEGLATVREIWGGGLVGSKVTVGMWRIPSADIPSLRPDRVEWLNRLWIDIDEWVASAGQAST